MLKIKSEAGVGLRRIGALYAAYGKVKGDVGEEKALPISGKRPVCFS